MKQIISIFFVLISTISFSNLKTYVNYDEYNEIKEQLAYVKIKYPKLYNSYLLARNDEIIIADNIDEIRPLASITKLVTAMIVIDNAYSLDQKIIITKDIADIPYSVRFKVADVFTVRQMLEFMLIGSSNGAAQALADFISEDFVELMNKKAKDIGLTTMRFYTPHGLPTSDTGKPMDVGSALDVYYLSKYALENYPVIKEIISVKEAEIKNYKFENTNTVMDIEGVCGTKTGYHKKAGYNISVYYEDDDDKVYEIILGSSSKNMRNLISKTTLKNMKKSR